MILQALHQLAQREKLHSDPDYENKQVAWLIRLDENGGCLGIQGTHYTPPQEGKRKPKPTAKWFAVPREEIRTSGDRAYFLVDKAEYVFGIDPLGKRSAQKLAQRFALFCEKVERCAEDTADPAVNAVTAFLRDLAEGKQEVTLPEECASNDLFAFVWTPDEERLVTDRKAVRQYWSQVREPRSDPIQCLVTGQSQSPARLVPPLKRVPGGSTSGVSMISYNRNAFESYGWSGNENAPIGRDTAEAIATALNRLLHPAYPHPTDPGSTLRKQHIRLSSDTVVCYWATEAAGDELTSIVGPLLEANPERVGNLYRSIWRGIPPKIDNPSTFYAMVLTGTQGRVIVRDWLESTVQHTIEALAQYFDDLAIVRNAPPPKEKEAPPTLSLLLLMESLADPKQNRQDAVPAPLASQFMKSVFTGLPFPLAALQRGLLRYRAEVNKQDDTLEGWRIKHWNDARAAIIKAVLCRRWRYGQTTRDFEEVKSDMDPNNKNDGYVLGCLMAVVERLQQVAIGSANATVVDRYFSGASANPRAVFVRLLKNARHHVRKARDDEDRRRRTTAVLLDRLLDQFAEPFDPKHNGFPSYLDLEKQGLFVLGYHQMRKWLWMNKDERQAWEDAHPDAPRAFLWVRKDDVKDSDVEAITQDI